MNRIERLKHQVLLDVEAGDYRSAKEHLDSIPIYTAKAQQQFEQFRELRELAGKPLNLP